MQTFYWCGYALLLVGVLVHNSGQPQPLLVVLCENVEQGFSLQVLVEDPVVLTPLESEAELQSDRVEDLLDLDNPHQVEGHGHLDRDDGSVLILPDRWQVLVVVGLHRDQLAVVLVGLVPAVRHLDQLGRILSTSSRHLVAPPLHLDALPIVAGELAVKTSGQLEASCVGQPIVAPDRIALYRPDLMFYFFSSLFSFLFACFPIENVSLGANVAAVVFGNDVSILHWSFL